MKDLKANLRTGLAGISLHALLALSLHAGDFGSGASGTSGAEFLRVGVGARAIAMGEAYSAATDDAFSLYWNPAGMTRISGSSLGLMHNEYMGDIKADYIAFARRVHRRVWMGGALSYMDVGKMEELDPTGSQLGSFHPRNYAATFSMAGDVDLYEEAGRGYGIGLSGKLVRSEISQRAQTIAFDVGAMSPCPSFSEKKGGTCALVAQNLGAPIKFDEQADPLPTAFKLGWAWGMSDSTLISAEAALSRGEGIYGALGTEWTAEVSENMGVAVRLGANSMTWDGMTGISGVSAGFGLKFSKVAFDYAVVPFGELGLAHRISLTIGFGAAEKRKGPVEEAKSRSPEFMTFLDYVKAGL